MKRLAFILGLAAMLTHAIGSAVAGSFNPFDWSTLHQLVSIFLIVPLLTLAIGVIEGAFA